ncbi:MAG: D-alanine--poly(phosphoribitol) ligase subunit DltA [Raoultibacter sp.]
MKELSPNSGAQDKRPFVVYGHKTPDMLVCFLACVKSGHPYVPVDTAFPQSRITSIVAQLKNPVIFNTTNEDLAFLEESAQSVISKSTIERLCLSVEEAISTLPGLSQQDIFYILFTSGSTGEPKGVEITAECVDNFLEWMAPEFAKPGPQTYFNRAPFSFDLSVTDLVLGLGTGGTLFTLVEEDENDLARTFASLSKANISFWISTPSFIEMCLRDPAFSRELLPHTHTFFFVGEVLKNETAALILDRFPEAAVINGYGPTEATVLVSAVQITPEMISANIPLPVGTAKPETVLKVLDPETLEEMPFNEPGELYIIGNTVGKGYYQNEELTKAAFRSCPARYTQGMRSYKTGDKAYLDPTGMLHFQGRMDLQIKLHGYRIELEDIEANFRLLDSVVDVCVLPVMRKGSLSHLAAYIVPSAAAGEPGFALSQRIKAELKGLLPEYMIPRKLDYLEAFPLNVNGKIDRAQLKGIIE